MSDTSSWEEYSKLVIKELENLNLNQKELKNDLDEKFNKLNIKFTKFESVQKDVDDQEVWIRKVNEIWSPTQMKESKDELYKQKGRWIALIAIYTVVQLIVGFVIAIWSKVN